MDFDYTSLSGQVIEVSFASLTQLSERTVQLEDGWTGDRINYCAQTQSLIEFQSGPESPPGFQPSRAREVTLEYVRDKYFVPEDQIASVKGAADAKWSKR